MMQIAKTSDASGYCLGIYYILDLRADLSV